MEISLPESAGGGISEKKLDLPVKKITLWIVLLAGVLLVLAMAVSLSREIKEGKGKE